jgi:hypothetical protein
MMKRAPTPLPELSLEQWGLLLHESGLHPSNQVRIEATPHLNRRLKTKTCVPALFGLLQKSHDVGVRQLAGVLLRKHLPRLWIKLDNNLRVEMQKALPEMLIAEQV